VAGSHSHHYYTSYYNWFSIAKKPVGAASYRDNRAFQIGLLNSLMSIKLDVKSRLGGTTQPSGKRLASETISSLRQDRL
jgi:hypothetical protein